MQETNLVLHFHYKYFSSFLEIGDPSITSEMRQNPLGRSFAKIRLKIGLYAAKKDDSN